MVFAELFAEPFAALARLISTGMRTGVASGKNRASSATVLARTVRARAVAECAMKILVVQKALTNSESVIPTEAFRSRQGTESAVEEAAFLALSKRCGWAPPLPG